jgi:hypothetical protein
MSLSRGTIAVFITRTFPERYLKGPSLDVYELTREPSQGFTSEDRPLLKVMCARCEMFPKRSEGWERARCNVLETFYFIFGVLASSTMLAKLLPRAKTCRLRDVLIPLVYSKIQEASVASY